MKNMEQESGTLPPLPPLQLWSPAPYLPPILIPGPPSDGDLIQRGGENYIELRVVGEKIEILFRNQRTGEDEGIGPFDPDLIPTILGNILSGLPLQKINDIQHNNGLQQLGDLGF